MLGSANDLRRIPLLRARTCHDFSAYKRATVKRRVVRRMWSAGLVMNDLALADTEFWSSKTGTYAP
ncbi:hypothetical protein [Pararhizobium sp. DWP3-4]|uniref:hypothetical protein n=1 Tax=unclassified Pararhizobium TaxID=2643050 RepID=UPI003CF8DF3E